MKINKKAPWHISTIKPFKPKKLDPPEQVKSKEIAPACRFCNFCKRLKDCRKPISHCCHPDALLFMVPPGGVTENTGYVIGTQPRESPTWCPLLSKNVKSKALYGVVKNYNKVLW